MVLGYRNSKKSKDTKVGAAVQEARVRLHAHCRLTKAPIPGTPSREARSADLNRDQLPGWPAW